MKTKNAVPLWVKGAHSRGPGSTADHRLRPIGAAVLVIGGVAVNQASAVVEFHDPAVTGPPSTKAETPIAFADPKAEESSERYKTDIAPMGPRSAAIQQLRPVTYRLKTDPAGELQYGLIAEEVNQVYPELVVRDDAGQIEGLRYDRLTPILLCEVQLQQRSLATQASQLQDASRSVQEALAGIPRLASHVAMR